MAEGSVNPRLTHFNHSTVPLFRLIKNNPTLFHNSIELHFMHRSVLSTRLLHNIQLAEDPAGLISLIPPLQLTPLIKGHLHLFHNSIELRLMSRPFAHESAFRAIADPTRRRVLDLLRRDEQSVSEL